MKTKILYIIGFLSICHFSKGTDDFNHAIDYLNCKLIELSLKGSDIKLQKFKNTCDCEIANFEKITSGLIGLNVNKTETLAINLNGLKNNLIIDDLEIINKKITSEINNIDGKYYSNNKQSIENILKSKAFKDKLPNLKVVSTPAIENGEPPIFNTDIDTSDKQGDSSSYQEGDNDIVDDKSQNEDNKNYILPGIAIIMSLISIILSLLKRKTNMPSKESLINDILTEPKVKEYLQKLIQGSQNPSTTANLSFQIRDLAERIALLEKEIYVLKNDETNLEKIQSTDTETKSNAEKLEVIYLSTPNTDGSFNESSSSANYREGATIYKFTKTSFNKAKFEIDSKTDSMKLAIKYPDRNIVPVCDAENAINLNATRIITVQPGEVELQGDKWIRITKAKIRYES